MRKSITKIILGIVVVFFTSCASTDKMVKEIYKYGEITKTISEFDGVKEISMKPVCVYPFEKIISSSFCIGAYKTSKMKVENIILDVEHQGLEGLNQLIIKTDRNKYKLKPLNSVSDSYIGSKSITSRDINNYRSNKYIITKKILKDINESQTKVRLHLNDNTYVEGAFYKTDSYKKEIKKYEEYANLIIGINEAFKQFEKELIFISKKETI